MWAFLAHLDGGRFDRLPGSIDQRHVDFWRSVREPKASATRRWLARARFALVVVIMTGPGLISELVNGPPPPHSGVAGALRDIDANVPGASVARAQLVRGIGLHTAGRHEEAPLSRPASGEGASLVASGIPAWEPEGLSLALHASAETETRREATVKGLDMWHEPRRPVGFGEFRMA